MPVADVFWGEIAPSEHLLQIYEQNDAFLDSLEGFAAGGLKIGDAVIVIATPDHLRLLEARLLAAGIDMDRARSDERYIDIDAEEALAQFMRADWPDENLFRWYVTDLLQRARRGDRRVRAFGEMVAVLWGHGHNAATIRLEYLWHQLCQKEAFSLFCAYPRSGFTSDASESIKQICETHSRVIS